MPFGNKFPNLNLVSVQFLKTDTDEYYQHSQDFTVLLIWWTDRVDALAGVQARLCSVSEITEDLEGVSGTALVGVNPVLSCRGRQRDKARWKKTSTLQESSHD